MKLTEEQQNIMDAVTATRSGGIPVHPFIMIDAVAGSWPSGKTHTLIEITKQLKPKNGLYLAYNKAIAEESKTKFTKNISCMTTHSLAYQNTINDYNLKVGFFNYKHIKERIAYEHKIIIIDLINEFCLSKYERISTFLKLKSIQISCIELW